MTTLILLFPVVDCGDPGNVNHATKAGIIYIYNNVVTYTCDIGYEMLGSANITCQASGFWSNIKPICTSKLHADFLKSISGFYWIIAIFLSRQNAFCCHSDHKIFTR